MITFDVYGTLVQWDEALTRALGEILAAHNRPAEDIKQVFNVFGAESSRLQADGPFRSFAEILRDSLAPAAATVGVRTGERDETSLLATLRKVPPHAEVPSVLARLARDHRLAPISNTDDDLIAQTLEGLGDVFETTITAEQASAYKPNPRLFTFAMSKLKAEPSEVLHVAQGAFPDLAPCAALGIKSVWVNRKGRELQRGLDAAATIVDLSQLVDLISTL